MTSSGEPSMDGRRPSLLHLRLLLPFLGPAPPPVDHGPTPPCRLSGSLAVRPCAGQVPQWLLPECRPSRAIVLGRQGPSTPPHDRVPLPDGQVGPSLSPSSFPCASCCRAEAMEATSRCTWSKEEDARIYRSATDKNCPWTWKIRR
ncbi:uncharacterized protein LOC110437655 [Sorghum bicolor]|uniref:uncharacterized protein LOC110435268 n=1 Tax=Sorghum bicolor TaxID=4558 RepID=UPI000B426050|nr:uncharacterized protein LOC110435268 [Sorghum bicolor]XP_021321848.1 uncharacterized protein LOC110437655 [Sorghum bicolor]|eukprot:XP_021316363.1 uncharacterized protein LOC110435268 [Sorghum bicolor]